MHSLRVELPPLLRENGLFGLNVTGVFIVDPLPHGQSVSIRSLHSLGIVLSNEQALAFGATAITLGDPERATEVMVPLASLDQGLPAVERWPGGPALPWRRVPLLEQGIVGEALVAFRVASEISLGQPEHDAAIELVFSGGHSLLCEVSEEVPTTIDVWHLRRDAPAERLAHRGRRGREPRSRRG